MHPVIRKARQLLEGREQQEAADKRWREEHADELLDAGIDQLLTKSATPIIKRDYGDVIHKVREDALVRPEQQKTSMSPECAARWNEWANSLIAVKLAEFREEDLQNILEDYSEIIGEEVVRIVEAERRDIERTHKQRIVLFDPSEAMAKEIEKATAPLRAEIVTLQKQVSELKKRT